MTQPKYICQLSVEADPDYKSELLEGDTLPNVGDREFIGGFVFEVINIKTQNVNGQDYAAILLRHLDQ